MIRSTRAPLGHLLFVLAMILAGFTFTYAAIQGDYGVLSRAVVDAEALELRLELAAIADEVARMENLARRLSDDFLDLDLLDEQARDVLGLVRMDEIVVR
jgi:cell division protein FtsB